MTQKKVNKKSAGKANKEENPATNQAQAVNKTPVMPETIENIALSMIVCNPFNPRKYRSEEDLQELTQSIVNYGIIQPITVRKKEDKYEIVCGERRYHASAKANLDTVPAIVKTYSDEEAMEICILENLQRRDINPIEEALSFGKLMEVRHYSIDDLVKQFGKTDKYIRSRLQLRNLTENVSNLLVKEEITLAVALELARYCHDIQYHVYENHLSKENDYSWKNLTAKEFSRLLENGYSANLSNYDFDKSDCKNCQSNSSVFDLFADGNGGHCQDMGCLRYKQAEYIANETTKMLNQNPNMAVCVAPNSYASAEIVDNLAGTGCDIYEMVAVPMPVAPEKPLPNFYPSETEYKEAEQTYETSLELYQLQTKQIDTMVELGKAQLMVDVSRRKPELCYRVVNDAESQSQNPSQTEQDTVEKLRQQDKRNKEIAIEKGVEDVKRLVRERTIPNASNQLQMLEEELMYYCMLSALRVEDYSKLGFSTQTQPTDNEKMAVVQSLTEEQKNIIKRDFIIKQLSDTSGNRPQSLLLIDFAALHFPKEVNQIRKVHNDHYTKKHLRIEERIREIQPYTEIKAIEVAPMQEVQEVEAVIVSESQTVDANQKEENEEILTVECEEVLNPETFCEIMMHIIPTMKVLPTQVMLGGEAEKELADAEFEMVD